jgi:N-acetylneuraminate synthase
MSIELNKKLHPKPIVVAEHCCNHMGDIDIVMKMISEAKTAGASFAKFQKWNAQEALSELYYHSEYPESRHSFGEPYGKHRENLEFTIDQHY